METTLINLQKRIAIVSWKYGPKKKNQEWEEHDPSHEDTRGQESSPDFIMGTDSEEERPRKRKSLEKFRTREQRKTNRFLQVQIGNLTKRVKSSRSRAPEKYSDDGQDMDDSESEDWAKSTDADKALTQALIPNEVLKWVL